VLFTIKSQI